MAMRLPLLKPVTIKIDRHAGLSRLESGVPIAPCSEIGWRLTPSAWHKGYAAEAARAWLRYRFDTLGLTEILS